MGTAVEESDDQPARRPGIGQRDHGDQHDAGESKLRSVARDSTRLGNRQANRREAPPSVGNSQVGGISYLLGKRHLQGCRCHDGAAYRPDRLAFGQPSPCRNDDRCGDQLAGERHHAFEVVAHPAALAGVDRRDQSPANSRTITAASGLYASTSISTRWSGSINPDTSTIVDTGRMSANTSPCALPTASQSAMSTDEDPASARPGRRSRRPWPAPHR